MMRVCAAQLNISWESKSDSMKACERFISEASERAAELVVFPELTLTGFTMNSALAEDSDGETCSFFARCAKKYNIACVFGYAENIGGRIYNRLAFADRSGEICARYSKLHPFTFGGEAEVYSPGSEVCAFSLDGMEFGLTVCYDLRFPELYRQLSKTCGCIIVSANWPKSRREHWLTLLKARAIENQCYMIGCNRAGSGGGLEYSGDSVIFAPDGGELAVSAEGAEQLIFSDIDKELVRTLRESFPVQNDRRNEIYRNFYE